MKFISGGKKNSLSLDDEDRNQVSWLPKDQAHIPIVCLYFEIVAVHQVV